MGIRIQYVVILQVVSARLFGQRIDLIRGYHERQDLVRIRVATTRGQGVAVQSALRLQVRQL